MLNFRLYIAAVLFGIHYTQFEIRYLLVTGMMILLSRVVTLVTVVVEEFQKSKCDVARNIEVSC
jgi:hypothetical protein